MAKLKEYYPSLVTDEYELGQFYMFNRNNDIKEKQISEKHREFIVEAKGGFAKDDGKGGFALDKEASKSKKGGFQLDDGKETVAVSGGFRKDDGTIISEKDAFAEFSKDIKRYGHYSHEAGRIIGVNKADSKIYVQFSDTTEGFCHIFRTGMQSDMFDVVDKLIQANAK